MRRSLGGPVLTLAIACSKHVDRAATTVATVATTTLTSVGCTGCTSEDPHLPLELVADVPLPGAPVRFDYQAVDRAHGHLVIAHMSDDSVDVVDLADGSTAAELPGIPTARGVAVAPEVDRIFVTA